MDVIGTYDISNPINVLEKSAQTVFCFERCWLLCCRHATKHFSTCGKVRG